MNSGLITLLIVVVLVVGALGVLKTIIESNSGVVGSFKPKRLLTANELEFLVRLESAVPELRICPQVAMGAVLEPAASRGDRKSRSSQRNQYSQKIIDFVAQRRDDGSIVAIIELDDRTHDSAKDAKRDAMLKSAGYRTIRWHSKSKPDAAAIRAALIPPPPPAGPAARIEPTFS